MEFRLLLQVLLLELALTDGKVAIEALKLLIPLAGESSEEIDPNLEALSLDEMEDAIGRALEYINSVTGDSGSDGSPYPSEILSAEVLSTLRGTKYADLPGVATPPDNNGSSATDGSGDNSVSDN